MDMKQKLRILYVCSYYKPAYIYGGPVQSGSSMCEGLRQAGADLVVLTTNANGSNRLDVALQQPVDVDGVEVWYFPLTLGGLSFFYSASMSKAIRTRVQNFDLVVAEGIWGQAMWSIVKSCARYHVPYIVTVRGQFNSWALSKKRLKKKIYMELLGNRYINHAAAIYCTDPVEVKSVHKFGFSSPTFIVPNAIHASDYARPAAVGGLRRQFGISGDAYILFFLGRLTQIKRPDIALDVLAASGSLDKEVHLVFAGPDEDGMMQNLRNQAESFGCSARVHFAGLLKKDQVISALADVNLLLMPSDIQENFGMSALEAMAAGVPILVSDGIPVGQWAQKVGAGLVVPCTKASFQQAALELLSKPDELVLMGQRGRELARERFDISVVARQMLAQYEAIVITGRPVQDAIYG